MIKMITVLHVLVLSMLVKFCCAPSLDLPIYENIPDIELQVRRYFQLGFTYLEILGFLAYYHGVRISLRTLNRWLSRIGLRRHIPRNSDYWHRVIRAVESELTGTYRDLGYRAMQARLRLNYGIIVSREHIRIILRVLDREAVAARRRRRLRRRRYISRGPGYVYHIDGWDKLKRFGLCVHGCIDGYSRRIMWLEAGPTNNDPYTVCRYFAECVNQQRGLPVLVRADRGSENVNVEIMQRLLRSINDDTQGTLQTTFLYGSSPSNQRIEAWWSILPSLSMESWLNHFVHMETLGLVDTSLTLHLHAVRYVYLPLLRQQLQEVITAWNTHYIRRSRTASSPAGKPDVMFHMPEIYGTTSFHMPLDQDCMNILAPMLTREPPDCPALYKEIFDTVVDEKRLPLPRDLSSAAEFLAIMLETIEGDM